MSFIRWCSTWFILSFISYILIAKINVAFQLTKLWLKKVTTTATFVGGKRRIFVTPARKHAQYLMDPSTDRSYWVLVGCSAWIQEIDRKRQKKTHWSNFRQWTRRCRHGERDPGTDTTWPAAWGCPKSYTTASPCRPLEQPRPTCSTSWRLRCSEELCTDSHRKVK